VTVLNGDSPSDIETWDLGILVLTLLLLWLTLQLFSLA
jgi:hypothetical protein